MMNKSFSLGGIVMIEKVDKAFGVFSEIFGGLEGNANDFVPQVKLLINNKLTHAVSIHQILNTYPEEVIKRLGATKTPSERSLYRTLERTGKFFPILLDRYQRLITKYKLIDKNQIIDFSSTYLEGEKAEFGAQGYSRDHRPDKLQINFGISTGINNIPSAITIQKGNTQDKRHMREMLRVVKKVIPENSILIFDAGANSKANKQKIRDLRYHYLTLKPKKVRTYRSHIRYFMDRLSVNEVDEFELNTRHYYCVKRYEGKNVLYIFFCSELHETQVKKKMRKFERQKKRGDKILRQRKHEKIPTERGWVELIPCLQKTLLPIDNPYINGVEGFFILESSVDDEPEKILKLYKERDKAEKFIRALKEGLELRPIRHWNKWSIIGIFFICCLANFIINLTLFLKEKGNANVVKNVKLLKKHLINLTMTVVYPPNSFRFSILSNVAPQILSIFGDFVWKFEDKSLSLRW